MLAEAEFDRWIEDRCDPFYEEADQPVRASIRPGMLFRILWVGRFDVVDGQRGIAWRAEAKASANLPLFVLQITRTTLFPSLRLRLP